MNDQGQLEKVLIQAYKDNLIQNELVDEFWLPINPENFSRNLRINHDCNQGQGTGGNDPNYNSTQPEQIKLEFVLDNTGTVEGNYLDGMEIPDQISWFLDITYNIHPEIHQPMFLKIVWGTFIFDCKLSDLAINYTLFKPSGIPLRAKLNATFKGYIDKTLLTLKEDKRSPDLTHIKTVEEDDNLPLMTHKTYGDITYYMMVAKSNNLNRIRNLKTGTKLVFPTINRNPDE